MSKQPDAPQITEPASATDPEGILLYGIERIADRKVPNDGKGGFMVMDAISANQFATQILLRYWKAKAAINGN